MGFARFRDELSVVAQRATTLLDARSYEGKPEEITKAQLLAPLWAALGYTPELVTPEGAIKSLFTTTSWVDYLLRVERDRAPWLMVEAKSVTDRDLWNRHQAQILTYVRDYARMVGTEAPVEWIVLTNFREWVFVRLGEREPFWTCTADELTDEAVARRLYDALSREGAVRGRLLEHYLERSREDLGRRTAAFLADLKAWRGIVANGLRERHPDLELERVREASHTLVLRLLLVRLLETFGQEPFYSLGREIEHWRTNPKLPFARHLRLFVEGLREVYNTELFAPSWVDDLDVPGVHLGMVVFQDAVPDAALAGVLGIRPSEYRSIYNYDFNTLEHDVLGTAYEQFLAHDLREVGGRIGIGDDPGVRKREGIYYTPGAVVDHIIDRVLGPLVRPNVERALEQLAAGDFDAAHASAMRAATVRVVDPACGSGSFLIRAHRFLVEQVERYNTAVQALSAERRNGPATAAGLFEAEGAGTAAAPRRIPNPAELVMVQAIHGVDVDEQAVGLARLALWTQLLRAAPGRYGRPGVTHAQLPMLALNLRCGNSLLDRPRASVDQAVATELAAAVRSAKDPAAPLAERAARADAFERRLHEARADESAAIAEVDPGLLRERPFAWALEFPDVFDPALAPDRRGFDAVIGNPPYFNVDATFGAGAPMTRWLARRFPEVHADKTDVLFYFFARGLEILRDGGGLGFIVSRSFLQAAKAQRLRQHLARHARLRWVLDFLGGRVFAAGIATAVVTLTRGAADPEDEVEVAYAVDFPAAWRALQDRSALAGVVALRVPHGALADGDWALSPYRDTVFRELDAHPPLVEQVRAVGQGMQTGANEAFVLDGGAVAALGLGDPTPWLRPRASNHNLAAFHVLPSDERVLWVEDHPLEELPPTVRAHLERHRPALEARAAFRRGDCAWYRFTWPLHADLHAGPKLMHSYRARGNGFVVDEHGAWVGLTNTTHVFVDPEGIDPYALCALLNSPVAEFRHRGLGGYGKNTGGGVFEYFAHQLERWPVPRLTPVQESELARLGRAAHAGFATVQALHDAYAAEVAAQPHDRIPFATVLRPGGAFAELAPTRGFDANEVGYLFDLEIEVEDGAFVVHGWVAAEPDAERLRRQLARVERRHEGLYELLLQSAHSACHHDPTTARRGRVAAGAAPGNLYLAALERLTVPRFHEADAVVDLGVMDTVRLRAERRGGGASLSGTLRELAAALAAIDEAAYLAYGVAHRRTVIEAALAGVG